ncbi:MAG TPA: putative sugar O-methyltransferase [Candidatus Paceibacterota bacterium]|nr:putative sugar O-methyltransferase [Candidatus Paceibacterota bacterium]
MENSKKLFEENFPSISQEDYRKASLLAGKLRSIIAHRGKLIAERETSNPGTVDPNFIWDLIQLMAYCFNPTYEVVNTWRLHTYLFPGNSLLPYTIAHHNVVPKKLLKAYKKKTAGLPDKYIYRPPRIMAECGWVINGGIVNDDTLMYQKHISALYFEGVLDRLATLEEPKILEIGSGYGALAYKLKELLPNARYYMIDLAESLFFSSIYLQVTMPQYVDEKSIYDGRDKSVLDPKGSRFTFVPNFLAQDLVNVTKFDLIINTGSFGEMTRNQVDEYAGIIGSTIAEKGLLYEENHDTVYDDLAYVEKGVKVLTSIKSILSKYLTCYSIDGRKKLWYANKKAIEAVAPYRDAIFRQDRSASAKRAIANNLKKTALKSPTVKAAIKSIIGR